MPNGEQLPEGWELTPGGYAVPADLDDDPRLWTGEPMEEAATIRERVRAAHVRGCDCRTCKPLPAAGPRRPDDPANASAPGEQP